MRVRDLAINLDMESREPLQVQIARALATAVREGWIETRPSSGTFAKGAIPDLLPLTWGNVPVESHRSPADPGYDLPSDLNPISPSMGYRWAPPGWPSRSSSLARSRTPSFA